MDLRAMSYARGGVLAMGVLYDYFRAADDAAAVRLMDELDGGPVAVSGDGPAVDAIDLKGIDPAVVLGQLVSFVRGADWRVDTIVSGLLWSGDEQEGPRLVSIDCATRDTLASIDDAQVPGLPVIEQIAALARRARDAGENLYCWCCL
ncbi:hypothetical protein [Micromonospora chersina]|uniref:hypothetical protein n=1 Tax=Micromonospora chersina TaxID=47854 RepID=UPI003717309D